MKRFGIVLLSALAIVVLDVVPQRASAGGDAVTIGSERVVRAAITNNALIGLSDQEFLALQARRRQVVAQGLPSIDLECRAGRYQGLEDVVLGQITIPAVENRYSASASLMQPLYTGGRLVSLRRGAGLQEKASASVRDGVRADVVLQTLAAYWGWAKAVQALDVVSAAVGRTTAHAADVRNMHQAGIVTDNEMLATDVLVDRIRLALEQTQRQVEHARAQLSFLTGMNLDSNSIPERVTASGGGEIPDENSLIDTASRNRPEREARDLEASATKELAKAARGAFYPQVYLTARYEQANPNLLYIPPMEKWNGDGFVGISVSWNLFDWGLTRAKSDEADARVVQAQLRLRYQEEQIALEVKDSRIALRDALERIELSARVLKSSERNLETATDLWKNGVTRHSDVLDAHSKLTEAQYESVVAQADVALARASLAHAVGQTVLPVAAPRKEKAGAAGPSNQ